MLHQPAMLWYSRAGAPAADRLMMVSRNGTSSYRERLLVGASKCHAVHHRLHRLEIGFAFPPITGRIDEAHRPFDHFHNGNIARRADLERADIRRSIDNLCRI